MNTKAILKKKFTRGFILTQENVIKLKDIITQRLITKFEDFIFFAKVYRDDSLVYTTFDIEDVFREENSMRNKITEIEFGINHGEFKLSLLFEKDDGCYLEIESSNKDLAYLTFSDTKDYLNSEVLKQCSFNINSLAYDRFLSMLAMLLSMICGLIAVIVTKKVPDQKIVHQILESTNVHEKINFILNYQINTRPIDTLMSLFAGMSSCLIAIFIIYLSIKKLYPHNIFYFGKEMLRHDKIQDLRGKIYWIIVIGLVISVVGGFIVNLLSK